VISDINANNFYSGFMQKTKQEMLQYITVSWYKSLSQIKSQI